MYFMLGFHLVCVLIIITVIGLINASQELRSPFPTFLCAKDICKKVFCFRQHKLPHTRFSRKSNTFCKHQKPIWDAGLLLRHRGWFGVGADKFKTWKRIHWVFFHPSLNLLRISLYCVLSDTRQCVTVFKPQESYFMSEDVFVAQNKLLETQDAWAPEGCPASGLEDLEGNPEYFWAETWPWLHTALLQKENKIFLESAAGVLWLSSPKHLFV